MCRCWNCDVCQWKLAGATVKAGGGGSEKRRCLGFTQSSAFFSLPKVTCMLGIFAILFFLEMWMKDSAYAASFNPLYRGARAQAMGNAFVAVADDEEAIFYNPAGLAGIKNFSINLLAADVDASTDLVYGYPTLGALTSSPTISSVNSLMGKDLYARTQVTSTFVGPSFGLALLMDEQVQSLMKNKSWPRALVGAQGTYGVQSGFGIRILKLKKKKGELRFGAAGKLLWRSGGYQNPSLTQLLTLDSSTFTTLLNNFGLGVGADAGFQFIYNFRKKITLQGAVVMNDIGNTSFVSGADSQLSNLTFGLAAKYNNADMKATLAYDFSHAFETIDWRKKNHIGLELEFPGISLYAGINQIYLSYGVGVDLSLFKIMVLSYTEEQATLVGQDPEQRFMLHASMKFDL
jgi:hypothetical protein